jgi:hypothetical protein
LTAFVVVAAFPTLAVPGMVVSGAFLIVVGLVGGAVGRRVRERRLRRAAREVTPFAPRAVREALPTQREYRSRARAHATAGAAEADAEDDHRVDLRTRVA